MPRNFVRIFLIQCDEKITQNMRQRFHGSVIVMDR